MAKDRRLRGHPPSMTAKYEAEGRERPIEPFASPRMPPLHEALHDHENRVTLDARGYPALHHEALDSLTADAGPAAGTDAARRDQSSGRTPIDWVPGRPTRSWLSVPQVARLLELDPSTVRDSIERGHIPAIRPTGPGGAWRIPTARLEAHLYANGYSHEQIRELATTWDAWLAAREA